MAIDESSAFLYDHKGTVAEEKQSGALATWWIYLENQGPFPSSLLGIGQGYKSFPENP